MSDMSLKGVRVLELGTTIAGPFCGRLLGDFGAEVIKVEPPEGDPVRVSGKRYEGKSLYAKSILRNKKLIALDLRKPEGQELVRKLAAVSDIVIENFRPGTLEKWGLGYDDLCKVKPDIIMVRISGYGQHGPYSSRPGYGVICEAVGGLRYITGEPGRPAVRVNVGLTDYITGLYSAFGAIMALRHRERTGVGQIVDSALYECAFSFMEPHVPAYDKLKAVAQPMGPGLADSVVNNLFATKDGVYVHVQGSQTNGFRRLMLALERPDILENPKFNTRIERSKNGAEMDGMVAEWIGSRSYDEVAKAFTAKDVTFTRLYTMADIFADPHYKARHMIDPVPDEELGSVVLAGPVPKLPKTPGRIRHAGGRVGQDTERVLKEVLGFDEAAVKALEDAQVAFTKARVAKPAGGEKK